MNDLTIVSIGYDKTSGEYLIKERCPTTGKTYFTTANRLNAREANWVTLCKHRYEGLRCIIWAN